MTSTIIATAPRDLEELLKFKRPRLYTLAVNLGLFEPDTDGEKGFFGKGHKEQATMVAEALAQYDKDHPGASAPESAPERTPDPTPAAVPPPTPSAPVARTPSVPDTPPPAAPAPAPARAPTTTPAAAPLEVLKRFDQRLENLENEVGALGEALNQLHSDLLGSTLMTQTNGILNFLVACQVLGEEGVPAEEAFVAKMVAGRKEQYAKKLLALANGEDTKEAPQGKG